MKINSSNEWGKLKVCVVGDATGAQFPQHDELFALSEEGSNIKDSPHPFGMFPQHILDEANEDLATLAKTLESFGVTVLRPEPLDFTKKLVTYDWETDGMYNYCPRDLFLVIDDLVIECPMTYRARQFETAAYTDIKRKAIQAGTRWIAAPRPRLLSSENKVRNGHGELTNLEPIFDAANVCRLGDDLLYLVSNSGNRLGGEWLQNVLGGQYRVHLLENLYSHAHIDSTITALNDHTILLNSARVNPSNCPKVLDGWDKIYIQDEDVVAIDYYQFPYASKWIAVNMVSIDEKTVICDINQPKIIKILENKGFTVVPLQMRHARTLGGGFHCVTLDLVRE